MLVKKTKIEEELERIQIDGSELETRLKKISELLSTKTEKHLKKVPKPATKKRKEGNYFEIDLLESSKIYHINQIKEICIDYRLRFLDASYFKGEIPEEAIQKIKDMEKEHEIVINDYKIMAPSKLFKLEDKDDPLLFAAIGNGYYYLIHSWGNDLHPFRKLLVWPFKSFVNLAVLTLLISIIITLLIPEGLFSKSNTPAQFGILLFFTFKSIAAIIIFYGIAKGKNFNPAIWNSKYFNG